MIYYSLLGCDNMIRINLIPIFMAINNEYGTDELIKRLKNILPHLVFTLIAHNPFDTLIGF